MATFNKSDSGKEEDNAFRGIWLIDLTIDNTHAGSGSITADRHRILGGDLDFLYSGSYQILNGDVFIIINIESASSTECIPFYQGTNRISVSVSGRLNGARLKLSGVANTAPPLSAEVELIRLSS